jgi:polyketide biosynthesis 3-hydroxy-3-methylglutaryl-CoA synthase-like enzyme PksG
VTGPDALVGIEALNVYGGAAQISVRALFEGRGLRADRYDNLMMRARSVALPFEDPVTNAVNACIPLIERLDGPQRQRIELVMTATESGLDLSKSLTSYVAHHLGLGPQCRFLEVKQACYAAAAGLQLAAGYLASGLSPGAKVLLVATDVALVDASAEYAEPATGSGAVAVLVGDEPRILALDLGAFGLYSFETMDTARPEPDLDLVDVDRSLAAYLTCLTGSFGNYRDRVADVDVMTTFDYLVMHTPFAGMVKAAHRKLIREYATSSAEDLDRDFETRVLPSLHYPALVGNLFSGSVFLALASLIEYVPLHSPARVGLFAYGSGCSSEFFSGLLDASAQETLAPMRLREHLAGRAELTFDEYVRFTEVNRRCLRPVRHCDIDVKGLSGLLDRVSGRRPLLALRGTDNYHRAYEWI